MTHYPILAIMAYFLGAFLIVIFGRNRAVRNTLGFLGTAVPLCLLIMLAKPILVNGEIIAYWMGNRVPAGGYAIGTRSRRLRPLLRAPDCDRGFRGHDLLLQLHVSR